MTLNSLFGLRNAKTLFIFSALMGILGSTHASADTVVLWDFTQSYGGWTGNPRIANLTITTEGLSFDCVGDDPWIEGPPVNYPSDGRVRVLIRMKTTAGTSWEFFYGPQFSGGKSVRFPAVADGAWHEYTVTLPALGAGARLRLDPGSATGHVTIAWIRADAIVSIQPPTYRPPIRPQPGTGITHRMNSGDLTLEHFGRTPGGFVLRVGGVEMAAGHEEEKLGYMDATGPVWLDLEKAHLEVDSETADELILTATLMDPSGGNWTFRRSIRSGTQPGSLEIEASLKCNQERQVIHVPWLTIFPGLGTYGSHKQQGLFAGLEYLADEPSSSTADINAPNNIRRVPDPLKITMPLMAINQGGACLGLKWESSNTMAAVFDSPDRVFNSGAHLMALIEPGVGSYRDENDLYAHTPFTLSADTPLTMRMMFLGARGESVVPAIQQYVALKGLPDVPVYEEGFDTAVETLAAGWLDSGIHEDGLWRHALWGGAFGLNRAADAPFFMRWLANNTQDSTLALRLRQGANRGLERLAEINPGTGRPYDALFMSGVSHVRPPIAPLLFGRVEDYINARTESALAAVNQFDQNGIRHYVPPPGGVDYSERHFADHANGFAAAELVRILEAASLSGDPVLTEKALLLLDQQTVLYKNSEPRGAQTWEVPLHTPDILASAHLVKCYSIGYELTGDGRYLEEARYWAWTGVPFVYLIPPVSDPIGLYATIPVYGATNWVAPNWMGLPVQWCGLVFASSLYPLSRQDPSGPWKQIADGITATGLRMTWPLSDAERPGLLPDVFHLQGQVRDGPAINPGTVQAEIPELYGRGTLYEFMRLKQWGWILHAPCRVTELREGDSEVMFRTAGWDSDVYRLLISRMPIAPKSVQLDPPNAGTFLYRPEKDWLLIEATGPVTVQIALEKQPGGRLQSR